MNKDKMNAMYRSVKEWTNLRKKQKYAAKLLKNCFQTKYSAPDDLWFKTTFILILLSQLLTGDYGRGNSR